MRATGVLVLCAAVTVAACAVSCRRGADKAAGKKEEPTLRRDDPWYELASEVSAQNERVLTERLVLAGRRDLLPRLRQEFALFNADPDRLYGFAQRARAAMGVRAGSETPGREQLDEYIRAEAAKANALDLRVLEGALRGTGRPQERPCPPFCR